MLAVHEVAQHKVHDRRWEVALEIDLRDLDVVHDRLALFLGLPAEAANVLVHADCTILLGDLLVRIRGTEDVETARTIN